MLLIDAIYINTGGGKILLDYLVEELEKTQIPVFYLLDTRIQDNPYSIKPTNKVQYTDASLFKRYMFYRKNKNCFSKVLAFGNVPPLSKLNAQVYTYMHNTNYFYVPKDYSLKQKIIFGLKSIFIKQVSKYTNFWIVQSDNVKKLFTSKFKQEKKIKIIPFFAPFKIEEPFNKEKGTFFYPSNVTPNKNHLRLIEAFCNSYDKFKTGKLILTINKSFFEVPNIIQVINEKQEKGYPIEDIGFVDRETLAKVYAKSEFVIFPSLGESFGLGLVEGIELGCKIIGANLPYTYAVCTPSLVFEPLDCLSIEKAIDLALASELQKSSLKVKNSIEELIKKLNC